MENNVTEVMNEEVSTLEKTIEFSAGSFAIGLLVGTGGYFLATKVVPIIKDKISEKKSKTRIDEEVN